MSTELARNATYRGNNYSQRRLPMDEYEKCKFVDCDFAKADLSRIIFRECSFENCNLGLVDVQHTGFQGVKFIDSKLIGLDFGPVYDLLLEMRFEGCNLDFAYFGGKRLKSTVFKRCSIREANFEGADLTSAIFEDCDLTKSVWGRTTLRNADLRSAQGYVMDPENNMIRGAKFSYPGVLGLLEKYRIEVE